MYYRKQIHIFYASSFYHFSCQHANERTNDQSYTFSFSMNILRMTLMYVIVFLLCFICVQTQDRVCSCSCCSGPNCAPITMGTIHMQVCTTDTCAWQCRTAFSSCQITNAYVLATCSSTVMPMYNCQCDCCRTGSTSCMPTFVGYSTAYLCQIGACSISCTHQYSNQCPSDHNGQTQGTCTGLITTTTTTTTTTRSTLISLNYTCSCQCCQSGATCRPQNQIGLALTNQCSSSSCTQACQQQYPSACPSLSFIGQVNGTCTDHGNDITRCSCQCCGANGCLPYEIDINDDCTFCRAKCQQLSPCTNTNSLTFTCHTNRSSQRVGDVYGRMLSSKTILLVIISFVQSQFLFAV
jgi:hypothetical protein